MKARDLTHILKYFDVLPEEARVPQRVTSLLTGESLRSLRRKKPIPSYPINEKMTGHRVGDVRKLLRRAGDGVMGWRDHLKIHPAADLFPLISKSELGELAKDIVKHGLRYPIILWRENEKARVYLLDGRNRLDAMESVGVEFLDDDGNFKGSWSFRDGDPYDLVLSLNVHRRHLTGQQKRELIAKLLKAKPGESNRKIAKQTKADDKTVAKVRRDLESSAEIPQLEKTTGADGKQRKVHAKKSAVQRTTGKSDPKPAIIESAEVDIEQRRADHAHLADPITVEDELEPSEYRESFLLRAADAMAFAVGNRHWQSWFRATPKLMEWVLGAKIDHKPVRRIIMRDEDKNEIAYNDKARAVVKMGRDLDAVNAYLARQTITLGGNVLKEGDPLYVDTHCVTGALRIQLRRIFNDASWYKGGRWWNDVQNIPKQARLWMKLEGYPVAVYDYSAFYPGLLYAMVGSCCIGDPYTIPDWPRAITKRALNILINTVNGTSAVRAVATELKHHIGGSQKDRYQKARIIIAGLKERNGPIAGFLHSNAGKHLMWHEAFILYQNMLDLMRLEIPFLPLHDALLVPEPAFSGLGRIMERNLELAQELLAETHLERQKAELNLDNDCVVEPTG
jgi:hypothetical protein